MCPAPDVTVRLQWLSGFRLLIGLSKHGLAAHQWQRRCVGRCPYSRWRSLELGAGDRRRGSGLDWPSDCGVLGTSRRVPPGRLQGPPGPEQWPLRTASSFGRGAPSCRGGEPRTLRGRGDWTKPFQVLSPKSRVPGPPPTPQSWLGEPGLGELGLRGGSKAVVRLSRRQTALGMAGCGSRPGVWGWKALERLPSAGRWSESGRKGQ